MNMKEIREKAIEEIRNLSIKAYDNELERNKSLTVKADNLMKYISGVTFILNICFTLFLSKTSFSNAIKLLVFIIPFIFFVISVFYCSQSQKLRDVKVIPSGKKQLDHMKRKFCEYDSKTKLDNKVILYYSVLTENMRAINKEVADNLNKARRVFYFGLMGALIIFIGMSFNMEGEIAVTKTIEEQKNVTSVQEIDKETQEWLNQITTGDPIEMEVITEGFSFRQKIKESSDEKEDANKKCED